MAITEEDAVAAIGRNVAHDCEGVSAPDPKAVRENRWSTCTIVFAGNKFAYAFT